MTKKLFVCNLDYNVTNKDLEELFSNVGTVDNAIVIEDKDTYRSKGYGFVDMSTEDEALAGIEKYNGHMLLDRDIKVDKAKPRPQNRY